MFKTKSGFTIVELLIVIVVIGILAAISIVVYNGIQQRAKNAQTTQAHTAWIKALTLYKAENGRWPPGFNCIGQGYLYGPTGTATSGTGQCRQTSSTAAIIENPTFNTIMQPYVGNTLPTPAFVTARSTDTYWWRGLTYAYGGGDGTLVYSEAVYAGDVNPCPTASGYTASSRSVMGGNTMCFYQLGLISDT